MSLNYSRRQVLGLAGAAAACAVGAGAGAALARAERALVRRPYPGPRRNPQWRFRLPDPGYASLTAARGVVYVTGPGNLYSLRACDGALMWEKPGWQSTPVTHGGLVYTVGDHGGLSALRMADGGTQWDFQDGDSALAAPVFDGPTAYVGVRVPGPVGELGGIWALDARVGTVLWQVRSALDSAAFPDSPVAVAGDILYTAGGYLLRALNRSNGAELWRYDTQGNPLSAKPQVANGVAYGRCDTTTFALSARTGEVLWTSAYPVEIFAMEVVGGTVYVAGSDGTEGGMYTEAGTVVISALAASDGRQAWRQTEDHLDQVFVVSDGISLTCAHPAQVAGGVAYPGGADGQTEVRAVRLGDVRAKWQVTGSGRSLTSPPSLAQGYACLGFTHEGIRVVSLKTGETKWELPVTVVSGPVASESMLFAIGADAARPDNDISSVSTEGYVYGVPL